MRERYWNFYFQLKHKSFYYMHFQFLFQKINWIITGFFTITTLSCIAAWDLWKRYPFIWASIICTSQLLQALFPKLPYNDALISTRFMISALDKLLLSVDHDWLRIEFCNLSEDEILHIMEKHQQEYSELVAQFFSGSYLPVVKICEKSAEKSCRNFFATTYNT